MSNPAVCNLPKINMSTTRSTTISDPAVSCFPKLLLATKVPTLHQHAFFLVAEDAEDIWNALQTSATNDTIINILAKRTLAQRLQIIEEYKNKHGADLVEDLKKKLTGDFKKLIVAMMTPLYEYYASEMNYAIVGLGTDENILTEILVTSSNQEIKAIRRVYYQKYNKYLEDDIIGDTSGKFKQLLVSLCKVERDESMEPDQPAAIADAQVLQNAKGADDRWAAFSEILIHRSFAQLKHIFDEYKTLEGTDIEATIKDKFSGDVRNGLLAIVASVKYLPGYFAKQLHKSMAGIGTNDRDLVRVVVTRCEIDMVEVKIEYERQFQKTLADVITDDTSGDYKKCLLTLIGEQP